MTTSRSNPTTPSSSLERFMTRHAGAVGLGVRLAVAYALPLAFDDANWIPGVAYTDMDYHVFLDAARQIQNGGSPYDRHTYRYTPFLALIVSKLPFMRFTARYVFCVADAMCGVLIVRLRQQQRRRSQQQQQQQQPKQEEENVDQLSDAMWWLYNPFAINICTRGSAEALVLLPVLATVDALLRIKEEEVRTLHQRQLLGSSKGAHDEELSSPTSTARGPWFLWRVAVAGMWHGLAVHAKLYPIIYTLSYAAHLAPPPPPKRLTKPTRADTAPNATTAFSARVLWGWVPRLLTPFPILFGVVAVLTFAGLTRLAYVWYGPVSLQEGLLYHVGRVDHRHNYSMFWYPIYLSRAAAVHGSASGPSYLRIASTLLFVPQAVLLAYVSLGIAPNRLALALFVQTFAFVALNKVITAQYFAWYLVLLPLCSSEFHHRGWIQKRTRRRMQVSMAMLVASILVWLGSAYGLEMRGLPVHLYVWAASVLFFAASVNVLGALLASAAAAAGNARGDVNVGSPGEGAQSDAPIQNKVPNKID